MLNKFCFRESWVKRHFFGKNWEILVFTEPAMWLGSEVDPKRFDPDPTYILFFIGKFWVAENIQIHV